MPFVFVPETADALFSFDMPAPVNPAPEVAAVPPAAPPQPAPETEPAPQMAYAAPVELPPAETVVPVMPEAPLTAKPVPLPPPAVMRDAPARKAARQPRRARPQVARIRFDAPTLPPLAHSRFCQKYAAECRPHKVLFRPGIVAWNAERRRELMRVNTDVNSAIRPTRVNETVAGEQWLIAPSAGDCNDYAVTKRHELLAKGWPSRALLLAEVVTNWGEHHLVLVVRTQDGDLVADSLNANIRAWDKTPYQWVRVQSPANPRFWSTIKAPPAVMAMNAPEPAEGGL